MKTIIRSSWPQVRAHVVQGRTYWRVDTRRAGLKIPRKSFIAQETALTYASNLAEQYAKKGEQSFADIDFSKLDSMEKWITKLAPFGKSVNDAVEYYYDHLQRQAKITKTIAEYIDDWTTSKINNTLRPMRPDSINTLKTRAAFFKRQFNGHMLTLLTKDYLANWFNGLTVTNISKSNYRKYLNNFCSYLVDQSLLTDNPVAKIHIDVEQSGVEFYSVEQIKEMAKAVLAFPDLTGFFSICLWAGVRPSECKGLTWQQVNLENGEILIPKSVSKVKKDRWIYLRKHGLDNLIEWLSVHKASGLPLVPVDFNPYTNPTMNAFKKKLSFKWIGDGLRHSFATYHFAKHQSLETLRAVMGNSTGIVVKHYQGAIPANAIGQFWHMTPASVKV